MVRHVSSKKSIPYWEEWLRIVVLQALKLMVDIVISGVVLEEQVEDIARQPKPRVIINSFNHSKAEKYHGCSCSHSRDKKREGSTQSVEQKSLKWVIVKGANCIRNNQPMVLRVDMTIQEVYPILRRMAENSCLFNLLKWCLMFW